jgi:ribosomal protein L17
MGFKPGKSGNPAGKPIGARNKTTVAMEKLLDNDAATITSKAIELAKNGDLTALRLCLERIIPPRKDRPVNFDMPEIKAPSDALVAATAIMRAVAGGDLTPSEAAELSKIIDSFVRVAETADLADRIKRLEQVADNT